MKVLFITGGSRGIGKELLKQFLENGFLCVNFSRSTSEIIHSNLKEVNLDLSSFEQLSLTFQNELDKINILNLTEVILINNAGLIQPIESVGNLDELSLISTINVNYIAPILLTNSFVKYFQNSDIQKRVINVSSGAANYPIKSWSIYCSTKSALDMFTKTFSEEQKLKSLPFKVINFYPGKVDTNMQQEIRSNSVLQFPDVNIFREAKENDTLLKPNEVALKIYKSIFDENENELFRRI